MAEHDPEAFRDLFENEPRDPSGDETRQWIGLYTRLVELLEKQLDETEQFAQSVPDALREYLSRENVKILVEELRIFQDRLGYWRSLAS